MENDDSTRRDRLNFIWKLQAAQQSELGLDPEDLNDLERRHVGSDLMHQMFEEAAELNKAIGAYKRHLLASLSGPANSHAVAEECADIVKCVVSVAQLHGVTENELVEAISRKTMVTSLKHAEQRLALTRDTRVFCTEMDDVVCSLDPWRAEMNVTDEREMCALLRLEASESMKNQFYRGGRFREMPPVPGAPEALRALHDAGYLIVIVTARPQWQYKRLHADTAIWLREHRVPCDLLLFSRNKLEALYEHVSPAWPQVFVEDHPDNARKLASAGVPVLLYDQPHNRDFAEDGVDRVYSWDQVLVRMGVKAPIL